MALLTQDLLKFLARGLEPAQLCVARVLGCTSDNQYVFRVRYGDAHLDYPVCLDVLSVAKQYQINWDELHGSLVAMSRLVVPPNADERFPAAPCIITPIQSTDVIW